MQVATRANLWAQVEHISRLMSFYCLCVCFFLSPLYPPPLRGIGCVCAEHIVYTVHFTAKVFSFSWKQVLWKHTHIILSLWICWLKVARNVDEKLNFFSRCSPFFFIQTWYSICWLPDFRSFSSCVYLLYK